MQITRTQKYFHFLVMMLMGSTFFPLLFNNLPAFIRSHHVWATIWVFSLIVFHPKLLITKTMLYVLTYGLLLFLAVQSIWRNIDDWNYTMLFYEFYDIAIAVSIITYFLQRKDYIGLAKITKWSIIFLFITAVMTIFSSAIDPMYARNFSAKDAVSAIKYEEILSFKHYGGGTYSTAGAFMCLFPLLVYSYKNIKISYLSKKQLITFILIVFFALIGMQILTNILIAIAFFLLALFAEKIGNKSIFIISILIISLALIPKMVYVDSLFTIGKYFENNAELKYKFNDLAIFIKSDGDYENVKSGAGARAERYPMLFKAFVKSPILGCFFHSDKLSSGYNTLGGHLHWMNKLAVTGIIFFVLFLFIPLNFIRNNLLYFNSQYKFYYILASLSIISYGLFKTITGRETWFAFFILLPGFYYLPLLKKQSNYELERHLIQRNKYAISDLFLIQNSLKEWIIKG